MPTNGDTDDFGARLWRSLESHELAVKRAFESVGRLEEELERTATTVEDEALRETLAEFGRVLEDHEEQMERVLDTLNRHKGIVQEPNDLGSRELERAMEEARRKARQESRPPRPDDVRGGIDDASSDR